MSRMLTPRIKGDSETVTVRSRSQRAELLLQRETRPSRCPSAPASCHTGPSLGNMPASRPLPLHRPPPATSVAPSSCGRLVMVTQATPPPQWAFSNCHGSWCAVLTVRVISGHGCDPKSPVWLPPGRGTWSRARPLPSEPQTAHLENGSNAHRVVWLQGDTRGGPQDALGVPRKGSILIRWQLPLP